MTKVGSAYWPDPRWYGERAAALEARVAVCPNTSSSLRLSSRCYTPRYSNMKHCIIWIFLEWYGTYCDTQCGVLTKLDFKKKPQCVHQRQAGSLTEQSSYSTLAWPGGSHNSSATWTNCSSLVVRKHSLQEYGGRMVKLSRARLRQIWFRPWQAGTQYSSLFTVHRMFVACATEM